jgi:hypothetical protein
MAPMTVVETPFFLRKVTGLLSDGERDQMIARIRRRSKVSLGS